MSANTDLPALSMWQARSTWVVIVGALSQLSVFVRFDILGFLCSTCTGTEPLIDGIMQIVAAVALVWTWFERRAPNYRLTPSTPKET